MDPHSFFCGSRSSYFFSNADPDPASQKCGVKKKFTLWRVCCDWPPSIPTIGFLLPFSIEFFSSSRNRNRNRNRNVYFLINEHTVFIILHMTRGWPVSWKLFSTGHPVSSIYSYSSEQAVCNIVAFYGLRSHIGRRNFKGGSTRVFTEGTQQLKIR